MVSLNQWKSRELSLGVTRKGNNSSLEIGVSVVAIKTFHTYAYQRRIKEYLLTDRATTPYYLEIQGSWVMT